jgi:hypothetical protein
MLILLLQLSIATLAIFVTYASVYGLGALLPAIAVPVMAVGTALELGKYVAVSYGYQHWLGLRWLERTLLVAFVAIMMAFTSAGVFAYLGQGYTNSFARTSDVVRASADTQERLDQVLARIATIEAQISNLPNNIVNARIRLMREYETERKPLIDQRDFLQSQLTAQQKTVTDATLHSGPISYLARITSSTVEQAATGVIMALTLCLDPFALFLTVLLNRLVMLRRETLDISLAKSANIDPKDLTSLLTPAQDKNLVPESTVSETVVDSAVNTVHSNKESPESLDVCNTDQQPLEKPVLDQTKSETLTTAFVEAPKTVELIQVVPSTFLRPSASKLTSETKPDVWEAKYTGDQPPKTT